MTKQNYLDKMTEIIDKLRNDGQIGLEEKFEVLESIDIDVQDRMDTLVQIRNAESANKESCLTPNWKCLDKVDWDLLLEQKNELVVLHDLLNHLKNYGSFVSSQKQVEALEGIITLLDSLQDEAEDKGIWVGTLHIRNAKDSTELN